MGQHWGILWQRFNPPYRSVKKLHSRLKRQLPSRISVSTNSGDHKWEKLRLCFLCQEQTFDQVQALWIIPWQGIFFVNEADFFDFLYDYTFSEMTDLPAIWYTIYVILRLSALLNRKEIGMATKCNDSKRRDHKGRILKTGESQRADLIYQYQFTDIRGKRHCILARCSIMIWS